MCRKIGKITGQLKQVENTVLIPRNPPAKFNSHPPNNLGKGI